MQKYAIGYIRNLILADRKKWLKKLDKVNIMDDSQRSDIQFSIAVLDEVLEDFMKEVT